MALTIKHKFESLKVDGGDSSLIRPSNWNDTHDIEGQAWSLIFRNNAVAGDMTDIAIGDGLWYDTNTGKIDIRLASLIGFFARNAAPTGWLKANGAAISRTTYATLFTAMGTTFGAGDGSTTFNVPDLRGYFARAWDDGRGVDVGRTFGSSQADEVKSHAHTASSGTVSSDHTHAFSASTSASGDHTHSSNAVGAGGGTPGLQYDADGGFVGGFGTSGAGNHAHTVSGNTGGISANHTHGITVNAAGGVESRPKNISLLACIKY